jgi:hypothetical protein
MNEYHLAATWGIQQWVGAGLTVVSAIFVLLVFAWEKVKYTRLFAWARKRDPRKRGSRWPAE